MLFLRKVKRRLLRPKKEELQGIQICEFSEFKIKLDVSQPDQQYLYRYRNFEEDVIDVLTQILMPGDVFFDVGAHIGWHTLWVLTRCPNIKRVHAFEPAAQSYGLLQENMLLNNWQEKCSLHQLALGSAQESASIKVFPDLGAMHSSLYPLGDLRYVEEEIRVDTLDAIIKSLDSRPAVIKCDVEGAELDVLRGARKLLSGKDGIPPIWFLEANYETAAMAGYFPWDLIDCATQNAPYKGYLIRNKLLVEMPHSKALRHGDVFVLAIPDEHLSRYESRLAK